MGVSATHVLKDLFSGLFILLLNNTLYWCCILSTGPKGSCSKAVDIIGFSAYYNNWLSTGSSRGGFYERKNLPRGNESQEMSLIRYRCRADCQFLNIYPYIFVVLCKQIINTSSVYATHPIAAHNSTAMSWNDDQ